MDAIEKQRENKLETIKKDSKTKYIVNLREKIDELFQIYPKSFNNRKSIIALEKIKSREGEINYKNLGYKIYFTYEDNTRSHEINF